VHCRIILRKIQKAKEYFSFLIVYFSNPSNELGWQKPLKLKKVIALIEKQFQTY
jgi:hypothetical protein